MLDPVTSSPLLTVPERVGAVREEAAEASREWRSLAKAGGRVRPREAKKGNERRRASRSEGEGKRDGKMFSGKPDRDCSNAAMHVGGSPNGCSSK
jgi:hypothetical protein